MAKPAGLLSESIISTRRRGCALKNNWRQQNLTDLLESPHQSRVKIISPQLLHSYTSIQYDSLLFTNWYRSCRFRSTAVYPQRNGRMLHLYVRIGLHIALDSYQIMSAPCFRVESITGPSSRLGVELSPSAMSERTQLGTRP